MYSPGNYFQTPQMMGPVSPQPQPQQMQYNNQMPIQSGGIVSVRSEAEARNYIVTLGTSVTFLDETAPYIYTKTMGFSQLDGPTFKKYKVVEEGVETTPKHECKCNTENFVSKEDFESTLDLISGLQEQVADLKKQLAQKPTKTTTRGGK
jgi:hypothetical protein